MPKMQLQFSVLPSASGRQFHGQHMHSAFILFSFPQPTVFSSAVSIQFSSVNSFQFDRQHSVSSVNSFQFNRQYSVFLSHQFSVRPSTFSFPRSTVFSSTVSIQFSSAISFQFNRQHSVFLGQQFSVRSSAFSFPQPLVFNSTVSIQFFNCHTVLPAIQTLHNGIRDSSSAQMSRSN